ncbi:MAG: pilus assembly protein TadG-related protein, partial [Pseudomonadota bacterium]|nr:pilus assembly protein TadG-related protein [Pseudomonadota bacterium]
MSRRAFERLWNDKRGSVLVIAGMAMPLLLGSVGLATDTIQWALWKRQLQRSADSAAMAGVYAISDGASHTTAVDRDLVTNQRTGITLASKVVTTPTVTGFSDAVKVTLAVQKSLPFSSMFMTTPPTIRAEATAAISKEGNYCMKGLKNTTDPSIRINGNVTINMGCGIISNSTSTTQAISVDGNAHIINATPIAAAGKVPSVNGTNVELSYQLKQPDPFASKYSTTIPDPTLCKTLAQHVGTTPTLNSEGYKVINPGCYKAQGNGNNAALSAFSTSNEKIALMPGTYYIDSANFSIGANTFLKVNSPTGSEGVTIILTGATPGRVSIDANADVQLRAPSTGDYSKMLFIQSPSATAVSTISGNT